MVGLFDLGGNRTINFELERTRQPTTLSTALHTRRRYILSTKKSGNSLYQYRAAYQYRKDKSLEGSRHEIGRIIHRVQPPTGPNWLV